MHRHTLRWALPIIAILIIATVAVLLPAFIHGTGVAYISWP